MVAPTLNLCSDNDVEPLPGTAKTAAGYVLLEHPGPWSRDVLDGHTLGPDLSDAVKRHLKNSRMELQLIRKPGREGRNVSTHTVFLVFCGEAVIERLTLTDPSELLELDLSAPGRNGATAVDHPVLLICTHGRRDRCCAIKGRPVAAAVAPQFPAGCVWESSHTKGHRFAPSMLLMPWNYSYGRLNAEATATMFAAACRGELFLPGCRGRGTLDARGQVAELGVVTRIGGAAPGSLRVDGTRVHTPDGRAFDVAVERREVDGVVSSCGDVPKTGAAWVAVKVSEVENL
ncbi:sucrase ferredoxin [Corynebacterium pacaense]|uniref:sucrase ferredoxin n=1 Tax=Corynebacterium pacaense TaxID=1816684 RepID=UPI0011780EDB|nr:sucrase ferredoxin [Corynebacterium pacaense]